MSKVKEKIKPMDGLGSHEIKRIRSAIRLVWMRCKARQVAIKRAEVIAAGEVYYACEQCENVVPRIKVDHITPVGDLKDGFIERLFCTSEHLQSICNKCHKEKTKAERQAAKGKK